MNELDPIPYREMMAYRRFENRMEAPNWVALVFDPRYKYEQDRSKYPGDNVS